MCILAAAACISYSSRANNPGKWEVSSVGESSRHGSLTHGGLGSASGFSRLSSLPINCCKNAKLVSHILWSNRSLISPPHALAACQET